MFIHNTGRRAAAVSLGILTAAALAKLAQAETPDPFVLVASCTGSMRSQPPRSATSSAPRHSRRRQPSSRAT